MCIRDRAELNAGAAFASHPLAIGIGLNCGDAVAGSIGSTQKLEFTVIGDTVNVASRLEGLTKRYGAAIVASRAVVDGAGSACAARRLDRAIVHGREEATELLEVLDEADPRSARIPIWEQAMDHYFAMRWDEAIASFEEAARGLDDPAARYQIERCRALSANPPDAGWTGVARLVK